MLKASVRVRFVLPDGRERTVEAVVGESLMDCGVDDGIPGFTGQCGGAAICGTCHCHVDATWWPLLPPATGSEEDLLPYLDDVAPDSRLACQVRLTLALDGIRVRLPAAAEDARSGPA